MAIVDVLEVVHVEHQQGQGLALLGGALQRGIVWASRLRRLSRPVSGSVSACWRSRLSSARRSVMSNMAPAWPIGRPWASWNTALWNSTSRR
jgi:hypothetical protein